MGVLEISTFHPEEVGGQSSVLLTEHSRTVASAVALVLVVSVHALLLTGVIWGERLETARHPDLNLLGDASTEGSEQPAMQWIVLPDLSNGGKSGAQAEVFEASFEPGQITPKVEVPPLPVLASSPSLPAAEASATDAAAASQLFGRYMGQINARIERAWVRPRTSIGSTEFLCSARITQDTSGNVLKVRLEHCNGDPRWQRSVVNGIQSASPLPAPPDPRIFVRIVRLHLKSETYGPQSDPAMYESASMAARATFAARNDPQKILNDLRNALHAVPNATSPSIILNITGQ